MTNIKQNTILTQVGNSLNLLTKDKKDIGVISWHTFPGGKVLEIHLVEVKYEFKRHGYGTYLIQEMIKLYPDYRSIYCHSRSTNTGAHAFYLYLGFKRIFEAKDLYGKNQHAVFFIKKLQKNV